MKSTKNKSYLLIIILISTYQAFNVGNFLNNFMPEETINEAINEVNEIHHDNKNDFHEMNEPEPDFGDLDAPVVHNNPNIFHDDSPIDLPYTLTGDYYKPNTKKFSSVKEYWEEEIFFLKWTENDIKPLYAIDTEKPVYKPGEIVRITILFYDRYTRKPLSLKEANIEKPTLKLLDANRKSIIKFDLEEFVDSSSQQDHYPRFFLNNAKISSIVEFKLEENFSGGFYTWEFSSENRKYEEKTNFFVSAYRNVKEAVVLDFNKDTLLPGDDVMAKVTLKLLGNAPSESSNLNFTYRVVDDSGKELESKSKPMQNYTGYIVYQTPDSLGEVRSLDIIVTLNYQGNELTAVKKLLITDIESVRVDFTPSGGKYTMNMENEVYFQAYADVDRTLPIEIENGNLIKLCYSVTEPDINGKPDNGGVEEKGDQGAVVEGVNPLDDPGNGGEIEFAPGNINGEEGLRRRVLESEPEPEKLSIWDRFFNYFKSMMDKFLHLNQQKIDDGGIPVPNNEIGEGNGAHGDGIWQNEKGLVTKSGLKVSPTNNYSKLPQNKYSTKKILDAGIEVTNKIKSNEDGKGSFSVVMEPNCSYYLTVTKSNFYNNFFMVNTSKEFYAIDHSDMRLKLNKKIFESEENLEVRVSKPEGVLATHVRLVIQKNGKILKEQLINFGACVQENGVGICDATASLKVGDLCEHDGGVYTVQIYREELFDHPEQESLIFVLPEKTLKISKQLNKDLYSPGDDVEIDITIDGKD